MKRSSNLQKQVVKKKSMESRIRQAIEDEEEDRIRQQAIEDEEQASSSSSDLVIIATVDTAFDVRQLIRSKNLKQIKFY